MKLHADIQLRRGDLRLEAEFEVAAGETVGLVGPNGAGKTSLLMVLAGLLRLERGHVRLGDRVLDGGPGGPFVPPEERDIGVVFQDHLLFPHLSALQNVAFGLRSRGIARRSAEATARSWLARTGLDERIDRQRPADLSGGQSQRVALARGLAASPDLLLLDEPLAAVDASARLELRRELRSHLGTFAGPRVLVAHDIADALALADRIVVLEEGRLVQAGTIDELVRRPGSRYVADLVGLNSFSGSCRGGVVEVGDRRITVASPVEGEVLATIHPRAISLFREQPEGSPRNVWAAPVLGLEPMLDRVRVQLGGVPALVAEVTPAAVQDLGLHEGSTVWLTMKATEIAVTAR